MTEAKHEQRITSVSFSDPCGEHVASGSTDGTVCVWRAKCGEFLRQFPELPLDAGERERLLRQLRDLPREYRGRDADTGKELSAEEMLEFHELPDDSFHAENMGCVLSVGWWGEGHVLSGAWNGIVRAWDCVGCQEIARFEGHEGPVSSMQVSPDGERLLSGSWDMSVRLWNLQRSTELLRLTGHTVAVTSVCFSPDARLILSGSDDRTIRLWDAVTRRELRRFLGHEAGVTSVCFSRDGRRVFSGSEDHTIRLWDVEDGQERPCFERLKAPVTSISLSPDGRYLLSGSEDSTVRLWEAATGKMLGVAWTEGACFAVVWHPQGERLAAGDASGQLHFWSLDRFAQSLDR